MMQVQHPSAQAQIDLKGLRGPCIVHKVPLKKISAYQKAGHWTEKEKLKYAIFILHFKNRFTVNAKRRFRNIFDYMATYMKSRSPNQCRSHHQKMQKQKYKVDQIVESCQSKYNPRIFEHNYKKYLEQILSIDQQYISKQYFKLRRQQHQQKYRQNKYKNNLKENNINQLQQQQNYSDNKLLPKTSPMYEQDENMTKKSIINQNDYEPNQQIITYSKIPITNLNNINQIQNIQLHWWSVASQYAFKWNLCIINYRFLDIEERQLASILLEGGIYI